MAKSHARRHLGRLHTRTRMGSDGDFVPSFAGGISPERFAANSLKRMITHAAARIVLKQMEGIAPQTGIGKSADPGAADVNAPHHHTDAERNVANIANRQKLLQDMLTDVPMGADPNEWLLELARKDGLRAVRVAEARKGYCQDGFGWDDVRRLCSEDVDTYNQTLLQAIMQEQYGGSDKQQSAQ